MVFCFSQESCGLSHFLLKSRLQAMLGHTGVIFLYPYQILYSIFSFTPDFYICLCLEVSMPTFHFMRRRRIWKLVRAWTEGRRSSTNRNIAAKVESGESERMPNISSSRGDVREYDPSNPVGFNLWRRTIPVGVEVGRCGPTFAPPMARLEIALKHEK